MVGGNKGCGGDGGGTIDQGGLEKPFDGLN